ncbi:type II toxin-antitoxin system RelB/DinJ family antitoxin [Duffyella gerundensis]|uniref:type II toxin-antitoxin system RelB/DinJ family antitoxin n=1 Tax=Duffyella gerundensis TaxID=1619313 RepID=UPI001653FABC|nr:type II toxin-antitoxin system RelB/DinJ family antitoxin [Duffyella gerundensis]
METRIQFRIESETKSLAKKALDRKGISLSNALRAFLERLASTETVMSNDEIWLKEQIAETFERIDSGKVIYYSEEQVEEMMSEFFLEENVEEKIAR